MHASSQIMQARKPQRDHLIASCRVICDTPACTSPPSILYHKLTKLPCSDLAQPATTCHGCYAGEHIWSMHMLKLAAAHPWTAIHVVCWHQPRSTSLVLQANSWRLVQNSQAQHQRFTSHHHRLGSHSWQVIAISFSACCKVS